MQLFYKLRPSPVLALLFLLLCGISLVSIWMLALPGSWLLALTALSLNWVGYCLLLYASLSMGHSCIAFRMEGETEIRLMLRNGKHLPGRISQDSIVTPCLVILNVVLIEQRGRRSLLVMPDTIGKESFRRLRIALKWRDKVDQAAT